ncbi:MAG: hypothetical protein M3O91_07420 [Chloroflexota bacterium]|nr:hypothetical protein [Chloroflexota bacterium]
MTGRSFRRGPSAVTALLLTLAVVATLAADGAPSFADESGAKVTLAPSDATGRPVAGPGYFVVEASPGATFVGHVAASNLGSAAAALSLIAVDAATGPFGGVSYALPEEARQRVGSWIELESSSFSVDRGSSAIVAFQVKVPADAAPGEHLAGLTAYVPLPPVRAGDAGLQVQQRAVVAVQVNVPGARMSQMAVRGVSGEFRPDGAYAVARLANSGNTLLRSAGSLLVTRADRSTAIASPLTLDTTVPGTDAAYPIRWTPEPSAGRYHAHIELAWDGGSLVWDSDFDIDATTAPGSEPSGGIGGFLLTPGPQDGSWNMALVALTLGILLDGLILLAVRRRRGRRRGAAFSLRRS